MSRRMTAAAADFTLDDGILRFTGALTLAGLDDLPRRLTTLDPPRQIDISGVERIDTVGAWIIHRIARDHDAEIVGADQDAAHLIEQVTAADMPLKVRP